MREPLPGESKLLIFTWLVRLSRKVIPSPIRDFAGSVLFGVTPSPPIVMGSASTTGRKLVKIWLYAFAITFVFSFGVIATWTWIDGTAWGTDSSRLYYFHDATNLWNYLLVAPLWVGFGVCLIVSVYGTWTSLRTGEGLLSGDLTRVPKLPIAIAVAVLIALSTLLTCNYIRECLDPHVYEQTYWYIRSVDSEGNRILGGLGIYYSLLTYSFFLVGLAATICILCLFPIAAEIARSLRLDQAETPKDFEVLREKLHSFVYAYAMAKCFAFGLMINAITWKASHPQHSFNFIAMGIVLSIVGVFLISVPRYYIEMEWFTLQQRRAEALGQPVPTEAADLRRPSIRLLAWLMDLSLMGSFAYSFWSDIV